jgi:hypothetical protein
MQKSTPINQLPSQINASQNTFVNDQQRQMIMQAQQAIGNSTMPQNTQIANEIINEDDSVIQDMLNNLGSPDMMVQQQQQHQQQQQQLDAMQQEEIMKRLAANNMNINNLYNQNAYVPASSPQYAAPSNAFVQPVGLSKQFTSLFSSELKIVGVVFFVVLIIQLVPFHQYVSKYIAIDKVPYYDVIFKAILAALLVAIVKKMV